MPINLELECQLHESIFAYRFKEDDPKTGHSYKKVLRYVIQGVDIADKELW